eukprot:2458778-Rhodomonas_salina.1
MPYAVFRGHFSRATIVWRVIEELCPMLFCVAKTGLIRRSRVGIPTTVNTTRNSYPGKRRGKDEDCGESHVGSEGRSSPPRDCVLDMRAPN